MSTLADWDEGRRRNNRINRKNDSSDRVVLALAGHCHRIRIMRVTESGRVTCSTSFVAPPTEVNVGPVGSDEAEMEGAVEVVVVVAVAVPACTRSFRVLVIAPTKRTTAD